MKKFMLTGLLLGGLAAGAYSQGEKPGKLKKHQCTTACTRDHHVYAHGEKGHVCTDACKKGKG
jgi:hypothetical protein